MATPKRPRRAPNRTATRRPPRPIAPRIRVAIATAPNSAPSGVSLANEVRLVRAAVLYADEVELISPGAEALGAFASLAAGDEQDLLTFFLGLDEPTITALGGQLPSGWRDAVRAMATMTDEHWDLAEQLSGQSVHASARAASAEFRQTLTSSLRELRGTVDAMMESSGASELMPAIEAGLLRVSPAILGGAASGASDEFARAYQEKLRHLLRDGGAQLLFDPQIASLVGSMIDAGMVQPHALALANAGEAAVGTGLIARLPAFPDSPLDELLDLRGDLGAPLSRYRRAVAGMATRLRVGPFDDQLEGEVDHLYVTEVAPALAELKEGFFEHGLVREVARALTADVRDVVAATVGPAVSIGATSVANLGSWVALLGTAASVAGPVVQVMARASKNQREHTHALEKHDLFYLFEVNRRDASG